MTAPFISQADLGNILQRTPEPTSWAIAIDAACEMVRQHAGQHLNYEQDDTVVLEGCPEEYLWLPERPVIDVSAVSVDYRGITQSIAVGSLQWTRRGKLYNRLAPGVVLNASTPWDEVGTWGDPTALISVTYSHGYAPTEDAVTAEVERMPSDLRRVAAAIASRLLERTSEEARDEIGYVGVVSRVVAEEDNFMRMDECAIVDRYALPGTATSVKVSSL